MAVFRLVQNAGHEIDFTNSGVAISAGDPVLFGTLLGIASRDIPADERGSVTVSPSPVYEGPLDTGAVVNYAIGDVVYYNTSTGFIVKSDPSPNGYQVGRATSGENATGVRGTATSAAAAGGEKIRFRLES